MVVIGLSTKTSFDDWLARCRLNMENDHARKSMVKITKTTEARKTTAIRTLTQFSPAGGGRDYFVHNTDTDTLIRGIVERKLFRVVNGQLLDNIVPTSKMSTTCCKALRRLVRRLPKGTLMSRREIVDTYSGPRKLRYEQALKNLDERDLTLRHFHQTVFIKYEALDCTDKKKEAHKPRIICPRTYEASLEIGRVVKPAEHKIYRAVDKLFRGRTIVKGLNSRERAEVVWECLDTFKDPVVIPCDASHADSSVDDGHRHLLHWVYRKIFGADPLIDMIENARCGMQTMYGETTTHRVKVVGRFGLGSGDQDTSLVMNFLMGVLHWTLCDSLGVRCRAVIDGDDTLLVVERQCYALVRERMTSFFFEHGFTMVAEPLVDPATHPHMISHCKAFLHWDGTEWNMVRDLRQVLSKDICTIQNLQSAKDFDFYRDAKSRCGLALAGDLPVYGAFYRMLGRGARPAKRKTDGFDYRMRTWSRNMCRNDGVVTDESRLSVFLTYGITPEQQIALENHYNTMPIAWGTPTPHEKLPIDEVVEQLSIGGAL